MDQNHLADAKEQFTTKRRPLIYQPRDWLKLIRPLNVKPDDRYQPMPVGSVFQVAYYFPGDTQREPIIFAYFDRWYHEIPVTHVERASGPCS